MGSNFVSVLDIKSFKNIKVNIIYIIFLISTGVFYMKIMRSQVFSVSRSILGMPTFHESCSPLHQSEEQPDTELLRVVPFIYYATC